MPTRKIIMHIHTLYMEGVPKVMPDLSQNKFDTITADLKNIDICNELHVSFKVTASHFDSFIQLENY